METKMKKSFIFNVSWQEVLIDYPAEVRLEVYDAVIRYAASGTLSEMKPLAKMAFSFIKKEIDYNNEKYNETIVKRSEAGRKGMLSRYGKNVTKLTNDNKPNKCYQGLTNLTNLTDNDNDNDSDSDNSINSANAELCEQPEVDSPAVNADKKKNNIDYKRIINLYHSLCPSFPRIRMLSDARKQKIRIRFQDEMKNDISLLESIFRKMEESKFLRGDNKNGWKASFDWLFENSKNWVKVVEGNYDNRNVNNDVRLRQLDRRHPRLDLGTYAEDEYTETF